MLQCSCAGCVGVAWCVGVPVWCVHAKSQLLCCVRRCCGRWGSPVQWRGAATASDARHATECAIRVRRRLRSATAAPRPRFVLAADAATPLVTHVGGLPRWRRLASGWAPAGIRRGAPGALRNERRRETGLPSRFAPTRAVRHAEGVGSPGRGAGATGGCLGQVGGLGGHGWATRAGVSRSEYE